MKQAYILSLSIFAVMLLSGCTNQKIGNNTTIESGVSSQQSKNRAKNKSIL